ncbi:MAG: hypothetical protein ABMA01_01825 [Chthoniobacteraceae bacterium]
MKTTRWKHEMELRGTAGQSLGRHVCEPDLEPAREAIRLDALRDGAAFDIPSSGFGSGPLWEQSRGEPYLAGIRVSHGGRECIVAAEACFDDAARGISAMLRDLGQIAVEERVDFEVLAFPDETPPATVKARFQIEDLPSTPVTRKVDLAAWTASSTAVDEDTNPQLPVFIPGQVIDELHARSLAADGIETGSILVGHLCRDRATGALAALVTAQLPAEGTTGDATRLKFTPATWEAAMTAVRGRGLGEMMMGTSHSHPARAWCAKCPPERQRACAFAQPFVSPEDRILHRSVFVRAWCVSLVVVDAVGGVRNGLFGWQHGALVRRGYRLLNNGEGGIFPDSSHSTKSSHAKKN